MRRSSRREGEREVFVAENMKYENMKTEIETLNENDKLTNRQKGV